MRHRDAHARTKQAIKGAPGVQNSNRRACRGRAARRLYPSPWNAAMAVGTMTDGAATPASMPPAPAAPAPAPGGPGVVMR
jgi:hypothetical protein